MTPTVDSPALRGELSPQEAEAIHRSLREHFDRGGTRSYGARRASLQRLRQSIEDHEDDLLSALYADFRKPALEAYTSEVGFCYRDIDHTLEHLRSWMKVESAGTSVITWPARGEVHAVPKGVVLVVAPWNYPVNLAFSPLIAALAAGCCVVLKPAEDTPRTAVVVQKICERAFGSAQVRVVQGAGAEVVPTLMDAGRFDHVFYTGSTPVGRSLGERCGEALVPCTLELGGKSPAIVMDDAVLGAAVDRIVWGKCFNLGQTCVAPDYVLVQGNVYGAFVSQLITRLRESYGANPQESPDLARVVNDEQFDRLVGLLGEGRVVYGGQHDASDRYIAPTVLTEVDLDSHLMTEEIFGPLLPVVPFGNWDDAKAIVERNPDPLAAYLFTESKANASAFIEELSFGGGCINDTLVHLNEPNLPFGGVHASGLGRYHGEAGFRTFTNSKSILRNTGKINLKVRYAPYQAYALKAVKWLLG